MPPGAFHMMDVPAVDGGGGMVAHPALRVRLFEAPPAALLCAVCNQLFSEAVILPTTGHTFCRRCVSASASEAAGVGDGGPVPNLAVRAQLESVRVHCPNGKSNGMGCQDLTTLGDLERHLASECLHVRAACPNHAGCGTMKKATLAQHLSTCPYFPCQYSIFGCPFVDKRTYML